MSLVLASGSETRRRMLEAAGVAFEARPALFDEEPLKAKMRGDGASAVELAMGLARAKAGAGQSRAGELVLGADQTLELDDGGMLDKPKSRADAVAQLERLSGRPHRLHAAAALSEGAETPWSAVETVVLHVRPLSRTFIDRYLDVEYETVRHNVGCYRIEGLGAQLFDRIEGSHFAILGLPLLSLMEYLRSRNMVLS